MIKFILQNWNKIRKIPLYNTDLSNNLQHPISFHCWKSENRSIVYVTDLHASITSCGCTDKILHFEPLLKCYELAHHSGPATTDRWRQWIRLFLTPDAEEGGREGVRVTRGIGDIPGGRSPLDSFILAADPENGKGGRRSSARMRLAATRIRTRERGGGTRDRFAILYDLSRLTILAGPWNETCFTLR